MIKESIRDLVLSIAEGDTLAIEDSFNSVMASKISDRLDSMRVDVAQGMFGSVDESYDSSDAYETWDPKHPKFKDKLIKHHAKGGTTQSFIDQEKAKAKKKLTREEVELEELTLEDYSVEELEEYMMSEDFEQLDEVSKATLGSYVKKASGKLASHGINMVGSLEKSDIANAAYHGTKIDKRQKGISKATDKLTKEEFELEEAVTASQLIANHNSSDHGGAQHFSNVDGKHHSWNYVKKNKEGTKYEVTPDKGEAEGIAHKGKFLKMPK
jgi:hypothetical protein